MGVRTVRTDWIGRCIGVRHLVAGWSRSITRRLRGARTDLRRAVDGTEWVGAMVRGGLTEVLPWLTAHSDIHRTVTQNFWNVEEHRSQLAASTSPTCLGSRPACCGRAGGERLAA